ncbi:MAG: hypothetical protein LBR53_04240 [Deltaproteobacteria bacterium]|jgi:hypothetical protein|nr:hypothetical protein [Deltaproteobacteria bacterium]
MRHKKKAAVILAFLLILTGGYFLLAQRYEQKAWDAFSRAADRILGENAWKAGERSFSLLRKTLTVENFEAVWGDPSTLNPRLSLPAAAAAQKEDDGAAANGENNTEVNEKSETPKTEDGEKPAESKAFPRDSNKPQPTDGEESPAAEKPQPAAGAPDKDAAAAPDGDDQDDLEGDADGDSAGNPEGEPSPEIKAESVTEVALEALENGNAPDSALLGEDSAEAVPAEDMETAMADESALPPVGELSASLHIVKIEIKGPLSDGGLASLLELEDWKDQQARAVLDKLNLYITNVSLAENGVTTDIVVENIELLNFALTDSKGETATGLASYLKHAVLGSFSVKNITSFNKDVREPKVYQTFVVEQINLKNPTFGDGLRKASNICEILLSLSADAVELTNSWLSLTFNKEEILKLGLNNVLFKDIKSPGLVNSFNLTKLYYNEVFEDYQPQPEMKPVSNKVNFELGQFKADDLDLSLLLTRAKVIIDSLKTDYYSPSVNRVLTDLFRSADAFAPPLGLSRADVSGIKIEHVSVYLFSIGNISLIGPLKPNVLPEKANFKIEGVNLAFPEVKGENYISGVMLERFQQFAKIPAYNMNLEMYLECAPDSGDYQLTLSSLILDQLATVSGVLNLKGITPDILEDLGKISGAPFMEEIGDVLLSRMALNYVDNTLISKIYEFNSSELSIPLSEIKEIAIDIAGNFLFSIPNLESVTNIIDGVVVFVNNPMSLTFDITPTNPVPLKTKYESGNSVTFYNLLNMTLRFNQGGLYQLKFTDYTEGIEDIESVEPSE